MSIELISAEEISNMLNSWYLQMRDRNLEKAHRMKAEIDEKMEKMEENQNVLLYYSLLEFRYSLFMKQENAETALSQIELERAETDHVLDYYYHYFKGIYCYQKKRYEEAIKSYLIAERKVTFIPDPIETAEFHYKLASVYSKHLNIINSIHHALKALEIYQKDEHYRVRVADCKNLLGTNNILLKDYERAEVYLNEALQESQAVDCAQTETVSLQNLGWMYSEQNMSNEAIRCLEKSLPWMVENKELSYQTKTMYLIAKECFKVNETVNALEWLEKAEKLCGLTGDQEYLSKLNVLRAKYTLGQAQYISELEAELSILKSCRFWGIIEGFAGELANYYEKEDNLVKALAYNKLVIAAKNKINLKED
ncbi:hypothetical protein [Alkalihalobacillus sp. AL-G]|uniref:response regulator aspartate phosphatase n=1 Tax=Alkalihalobacillus sp. AL-G TaxID=2926399 RepID=UPI00272D415F|nr:hypothetical protein [Alkalihalobacillus sp. AL-G]WLD92947.1 hypothetical protein MOJ78_18380 [Alkalihalobacillus sp. AL-G]